MLISAPDTPSQVYTQLKLAPCELFVERNKKWSTRTLYSIRRPEPRNVGRRSSATGAVDDLGSWLSRLPFPRLGILSVSSAGVQRAGDVVLVLARPFPVLLPVDLYGSREIVGVEPALLVKDVSAGGDDDRRSGSVGVAAPHWLVEGAIRVAREVVREDDLWVAGAF